MCALTVSPQPRVPPHDLEAETSVLGAILLDPQAITRVLDVLSPDDFYRENNGQIYRAAQNLFREGEPIDNVTLAAELAKLGVLERVGGRAHLALLQESVPTAANVEHYARIVKGRAYKRRLISAGTQVTALGYDESLDADEAVNQAQANVYAISDDRAGSGMEHIYNLLKPAMDRIDAQMASGGGVIGIPSGFHDLDRMTNGFKAADLVIIAGRPSMGKALALDTPIPTPDGWTTMGELRAGDRVFDDRGRPCAVTYATPVMLGHPCYEVVFSDGETIVADADHLWAVRQVDGRSAVLTTRQLADAVAVGTACSVPTCGPLRYRRRDLPVDPRELGTRLVAAGREPEPAPAGQAATAVAERVQQVPRAYLEAAVDQRLALLQGLMGGIEPAAGDGPVVFRSASQALVDAAAELAVGLGISVRAAPGRLEFRTASAAEWATRAVVAVVPAESVPVRCIQVDSPARLYLAGRGCVPTHNTSFVLNVTLHAAVEHKKPVAIFSLEMSKEQLVERMLCEQARIDAQRLHRGTLSDIEYERLAGALGPLGDAPIFIDDSPMLDDLTMRLKARQGRSREGIELIVLDYLQLMHGRQQGGDANRVQEVSAISRALKSIARELRIPVIAISQLSRAPEARPDKRPILSDLRESGCMPASTRLLRADTGAEVTMGELVLSQEQPLVWSIDSEWRMVPRQLLRTFPTGIRPVFRLRLASGQQVDATANHQFRTVGGWKRLDELETGELLAVPRRVPAPLRQSRWDGCHGERGTVVPACPELVRSPHPNPNVDLVPWAVASRVRSSLVGAGVTHRQLAAAMGERYCGSHLLGNESRPRRYSRERLARIAEVVADRSLSALATSDVFWDEVVEITSLGEMPTFDATVEDTHNFIANGVVAHNSIEQDADIVMFLYRDEYYNREKTEKPGIAEIIVAKHRNGPTGAVELMFRKELTRFENLERRRPESTE